MREPTRVQNLFLAPSVAGHCMLPDLFHDYIASLVIILICLSCTCSARSDSLIRHAKVHAKKTSRRTSTASKTARNVEHADTAQSERVQLSATDIDALQHLHNVPEMFHYTSDQNATFHTVPEIAPRSKELEAAIDPLLSQHITQYTNHAAEQQIDPMLMTGNASFSSHRPSPAELQMFQSGYTADFER